MKYKIQCYELYEPGSLLGVAVAPYEEPGQINIRLRNIFF